MPTMRSTILRLLLPAALFLLVLSCGGDGGGPTGEGNPVPTLTSLSRDTASYGITPFSITLRGGDFVAGAVASVDSAARITSYINDSTLTMLVDAADMTAAGDHSVRVKNPVPGGGYSGALTLHVFPPLPAPTIDSLSPDSIARNSPFVLHVYGTSFAALSVIRWNDSTLATTRLSPTHLSTSVPGALVAGIDSAMIKVFTPAPGGGLSPARRLTVVTPPTITGVTPDTMEDGLDTLPVTVRGLHLTGTDTIIVTHQGETRRYLPTAVTDTAVIFPLDRTWLTALGNIYYQVHAPFGYSNQVQKEIRNPAPVITSIAPDTVEWTQTLDTVIVTGTGFLPGMIVKVDGGLISATEFVNGTTLRAILNGSNFFRGGIRPLVVYDGWENVTSNAKGLGLRSPVPTLDSIQGPGLDSVNSLSAVALRGADFRANSVVMIGGVPHTPTFVDATGAVFSLTAQDTDSTGTVMISVMTAGPGGGTSAARPFQIVAPNPAPTLQRVDRTFLPQDSTVTVTLHGAGFTPGDVVERYFGPSNGFNPTSVVASVYINDSTRTVTFPASPGVAAISVHLRLRAPFPTRQPSAEVRLDRGGPGVLSLKVVPGAYSRLISDPVRDRLYALRAAGGGPYLLTIDPSTGTFLDSLAVPGANGLAIAADGSALYVSRYTLGVSVLDPVDLSLIRTIDPGKNSDSIPWAVTGIVAGRTDPDRLALQLFPDGFTPTAQFAIRVYEGDTLLPGVVEYPSDQYGSTMAFTPDDQSLIAISADLSDARFRRMGVTATGLTSLVDSPGGRSPAWEIVTLGGGVAFTARSAGADWFGQRIDAATGALQSQLTVQGPVTIGRARGDSAAYFATVLFGTSEAIFHVGTLGPTSSTMLAPASFPSLVLSVPNAVAVWGTNGFALASGSGLAIGRSDRTKK